MESFLLRLLITISMALSFSQSAHTDDKAAPCLRSNSTTRKDSSVFRSQYIRTACTSKVCGPYIHDLCINLDLHQEIEKRHFLLIACGYGICQRVVPLSSVASMSIPWNA